MPATIWCFHGQCFRVLFPCHTVHFLTQHLFANLVTNRSTSYIYIYIILCRSSHESGDANLGVDQVLSEYSSTVTEVLSGKDMHAQGGYTLILHMFNLILLILCNMYLSCNLQFCRLRFPDCSEVHNKMHKNFKSW